MAKLHCTSSDIWFSNFNSPSFLLSSATIVVHTLLYTHIVKLFLKRESVSQNLTLSSVFIGYLQINVVG